MQTVTMAEVAAAYPALAAVATARAAEPPEQGRWLDGPGLAAWVYDTGGYPRLTTNAQRRVRAWRSGGAAHLDAADRILLELGYGLDDLPAWLWIDKPRRSPNYWRKWTVARRREVARRLIAARGTDQTANAICREYDVAPQTARLWVRRYEEGQL